MSTIETNAAAAPEEDQKDSPSVLMEISTPINFAQTTAADFGITVQSFIPPSLPSSNQKSRLAELKARRRSNIGVRGSPETNSLIRFMAQQRMKTPPSQLVKSSPFLPRVSSTLRQKMASFQSLMGAEEEESEDSSSGGCITTRDDLSGEAPYSATGLILPMLKREPCQRDCFMESGAAVALSSFTVKYNWIMTGSYCHNLCSILYLSFEMITESFTLSVIAFVLFVSAVDSLGSSTVKKKKKQVRFGEALPPELFDKNLPPSTPLKKGGTPARAQTPGGALRSLLKTPQRSDSPTAQQHPEFSSPSVFGASPSLSIPRGRRMALSEDDDEQMSGKVLSFKFLITSMIFHSTFRAREGGSYFGSNTVSLFLLCLAQLPEESEPVKRSSRAAAKTASGKMKSATLRGWSKKVDRSLYGSREYASKDPSLSPIAERLSSELSFITEDGDPAVSRTGDTAALNASTTPKDSLSFPPGGARRTRRPWGSRVTGRALRGRKVSVNDEQAEGSVHERSEESAAFSNAKREEPEEAKLKESAGDSSQDSQADDKMNHEIEREQPENTPPSPTSQQVEFAPATEALLSLRPWQDDFDFEDVFKPVPTRGQRSVRRSLRKKSSVNSDCCDGGSAWLPHVSPETIRESRRRTRGRRSPFYPLRKSTLFNFV
uniref:PP1-binding domain-containing protein n=1 Tax=Neogobius melanostomus TaxID=47308 RepID=A0A8C6TL56_9GOBI